MQPLRCGFSLILGALLLSPWVARAADTDTPAIAPADPALTRFVQSAVDANPRVQAARLALDASGAFRDAASRPLYNPELSLDAENGDVRRRALGISQTLDLGGKREARTAVADFDRLVVQAQYSSTRWEVTVELLNGLAQHQTGVDSAALANARRRLMDDFAALAERRFEAGDLTQVELDLARLSTTNARIQAATAEAALAEARQVVRSVVPGRGGYADPGGAYGAPWPELPDAAPNLPTQTDPQAMIAALPEIVAARQRVAMADAVVDLRQRERRPDPTLSLAGGKEGGETMIGVNVTVPLFVRNRFSAQVAAASAERNQAEQSTNDVQQRAHARLVSATERYALSRGAWQMWQGTGEASLQRQTEQLQKLWSAGELSTTEYLVQLTATLDVQQSALELREALWRAWFEWLRASGQIDVWLGQGERP
ncbi:MAG: TolC family protein [Silicimonas sp.]|nr:TolC family protein [Silicimonas sp.]